MKINAVIETNPYLSSILFSVGLVCLITIIYYLFKHPEISFGLFLLAGNYKAAIEAHLPNFIDLTLILGLLVIISILTFTIKKGVKIPVIPLRYLLPYVGLAMLMFFSLLYTDSPGYGTDKFLRFITITALAAFGPFFLMTNLDKFKRFFFVLVFVSTLLVFYLILFSPGSYLPSIFGITPIAWGRKAGISALIIVYFFLFQYKSNVKKFLWFGILLINLIGLWWTGARGPVATLFLSVIIVTSLSIGFKIKKVNLKIALAALLLTLICAVLIFSYSDYFSTTLSRFTRFQEGMEAASPNRLTFIKNGILAIESNPLFGLGVGGFKSYISADSIRAYPHNIILELGSELGIIGIVLFISLIGFCLEYQLKIKASSKGTLYSLTLTMIGLTTYTFFNALLSGDINDNRLLFTFMASGYALGIQLKNALIKNMD